MMMTARLGDLCEIQSGGTPRREERRFYGGSIPWAKIGDLESADGLVTSTEESLTDYGLAAIRGRLFPPGTVLLAMYGSVGKVAVAGVAMATNQAILGIRVRRPEVLSPEYLRRWLEKIQAELVFGARGVTQQNISATLVRDLRIPLPPLAEQQRIAAVLDKANAIRRKRRESLRLLDDFLRSAFLEMFGDPVRNEKGWEVVRIGDLILDARYGTSARANNERRGLPVLRMNNVTRTGSIDLTDIKWCEIRPQDTTKYTVRRGDLLFNRTNSPELVGKTAVWDRDETFAFAGYLIRVRFNETRVLPEFVSDHLNSAYGKRMLFEKAKPSINMSNISATELKRLPIPLPPLDVQRQYSSVLKKAKHAAERMVSARLEGDSLFDSLEQRAFSAGGLSWEPA